MSEERVNESPDQQHDSAVIKLIEQYASCDRRSAEITDERSIIRKNAEKLGYSSLEFQEAVRKSKKMTKPERIVHDRHVNKLVNLVEGKQAEFWPEEARRAEKRTEEKKRKDAEAKTAAGRSPDHPRSDPKKGGAGKAAAKPKAAGKGKKGVATAAGNAPTDPKPAEIAAGIGADAPDFAKLPAESLAKAIENMQQEEQAEGGAVIDSMRPQSQSAQAAAVREKLGLD